MVKLHILARQCGVVANKQFHRQNPVIKAIVLLRSNKKEMLFTAVRDTVNSCIPEL